MMNLSTKVKYGLGAMIELTEQHGKGLVQIKDLSSRRKIPYNYLVQILNRLQKKGLIQSERGHNGGYRLRSTPTDITVLEVIEALEGGILFRHSGDMEVMQELYLRAEASIKEIFSVPLAEIAQRQRQLQQKPMFMI